jgi:hypothetical protein
MDFAGFESDGGLDLRSGADFDALVNAGGLMYLGHGEKFTRLELRLEETAPTEPKAAKGDSLGV